MKVFVAGATGVIGPRAVPGSSRRPRGHRRGPRRRRRTGARAGANAGRGLAVRPRRAGRRRRRARRRRQPGDEDPAAAEAALPRRLGRQRPHPHRGRGQPRRRRPRPPAPAATSRSRSRSPTPTAATPGSTRRRRSTPPALAAVAAAEAPAARFTAAGGTGSCSASACSTPPTPPTPATWSRRRAGGRHRSPAIPDAYQSTIHADDAAAAVVAALDAPAGTYDVVEASRSPAPRCPRLSAPPGFRASRGRRRARRQATAMLARSQRVSNRRFKEATGWAPAYPGRRRRPAHDPRRLLAPPKRPARQAGPAGAFVLAGGGPPARSVDVISAPLVLRRLPGSAASGCRSTAPTTSTCSATSARASWCSAVLIAAFLRPERRYLVRVAALVALFGACPTWRTTPPTSTCTTRAMPSARSCPSPWASPSPSS